MGLKEEKEITTYLQRNGEESEKMRRPNEDLRIPR